MTSPGHGWERAAHQAAVSEALQALGISRLHLAIHDASFPAGADDVGRGTPYSDAARAFFGFTHALGFTGVQLGPQGLTSRENPSPYDAMLFSREPLSIYAAPLVGRDAWRELVGDVPWTTARRADHGSAFDRQYAALAALWRARRDAWSRDVDAFSHANESWLERDARLDPMAPEEYRFVQWLAHRQHDELRAHLGRLGLQLWGDLQIGISWRDRQALAPLFLDGYAMGAPPSRTNPEGQPWGYPVLDPAQYDGGAGALVDARMGKLLAEYDGLRIDHPHGLVDPWVYRVGDGDAHAAVRAGGRLFSSPDVPEHPRLAAFAIARAGDLDRGELRWADGWVRALDDEQIDRYARMFDRVVDRARRAGHRAGDLLCEVLSTWPYPLRRVMEREGLGRLCVTQKANLDDARDVYRGENTRAEDWIMVGNHDTPPLWALVDKWHGTATAAKRATHLAERLEPDAACRASFAASLRTSPGRLATAMFAELFASPAESVSIFFADLFGYRETYNAPGTVSDDNWRLRVAPDFAAEYARAVGSDDNPRALSLPRALAIALRADPRRARVHEGLLLRLDAFADER
ncbi:MAG TPA: 4-alpha-glucanotransferase [Polyangia bacterium]